MEEPFELQRADEFIAFLRAVARFKLKVEIALIVDNQVCQSTLTVNAGTVEGYKVVEYLAQTAVGARLRQWGQKDDGMILWPGVDPGIEENMP